MPVSSVDNVVTNPGSNGAKICGEIFTDSGDSIVKFLPWTAVLYGTQNGTYELVNATTPLPVTLGSTVVQVGDNSTTLSVDDGAGSLTVDGTVTANCRDGAGNNLESTTSAPSGSARGLVVRGVGGFDQGAAAAVASAWPLKVSDGTSTCTITTISSQKALDVNIAGGVGGSSMTDDAAFTPGTSTFTAIGGTYRSSRDAVDDNDGGALAMTSKRGLFVSLETITGDPCTDDGINAVKTMILDDAGNQITSFGGGVQYTEAAVDASITGTAMLWEDTADTLRTISAAKPLPVNIISGGGSGGTSLTDDSTFTFGTTLFTPTGGVYHSTRDAVDVGEGGAFAMNAKRAIYATLETPNSDSVMNDTLDAVKTLVVDGAGSQITSFTTNILDDAAFTVGTTPITPVGGTYKSVRDAVDDNDGGAFAMTPKRAQYVALETPNADSAMDDTLDAVKVVDPRAATSAVTSVAASATSVQLLAANTARLGATVFNDSTVTGYLKLGTTASTTSYTVKLAADAYYEVPFNYTGRIDCIWDSASGNARIVELTA